MPKSPNTMESRMNKKIALILGRMKGAQKSMHSCALAFTSPGSVRWLFLFSALSFCFCGPWQTFWHRYRYREIQIDRGRDVLDVLFETSPTAFCCTIYWFCGHHRVQWTHIEEKNKWISSLPTRQPNRRYDPRHWTRLKEPTRNTT